MDELSATARAKVAERLCTNFFDDDARRSPGFRHLLAEQVERVIKIAETFEGGERETFTYDELNKMLADGAVLEGLLALGLVSETTALRWHARIARFMEATAAAMLAKGADDNAKVGDVLTEQAAVEIWKATA
jgi:hypothetical protein